MGNDYLSKGEYNVICDRCGKKLKSSKVSKEWTGLIVCGECLDERHPQDFVRGVRDDMKVPFARPLPPPTYYIDTVTYSTGGTLLAPSGYGPEDDWDNVNAIILRLNSGTLSSATEAQVLSGANFIAIEYSTGNWEILQYQNATQLTSTTYSLSKLLRARFGTESYMGAPTGARFIFIGQISESAFYWLRNNLSIYSELYSPCNIYGYQTSPDILINLTRRSQRKISDITNWMTPYDNAPLDTTEEIYELDILDSDSEVVRTIRLNNETSCIYTESQQVADFGSTQGRITLNAYQVDPIMGRGTVRSAKISFIKAERLQVYTQFNNTLVGKIFEIGLGSFTTTFNSADVYNRKITAERGNISSTLNASNVTKQSLTYQFFATSGSGSFVVPSSVTNVRMGCIGGGGNGSTQASNLGAGGGGGAYSYNSSVSVAAGNTIYYYVAPSSSAHDSWIRYQTNSAPSSTSDGCLAKGGSSASGATPGNGGASGSCVGTTSYSGGSGVAYGGGGGAAGNIGAGKNGGAIGTGYGGGGGGGSNGGSSSAGGSSTSETGATGGAGTGGSGGGAGGTSGSVNGGNGSSGGGGGGGYGDGFATAGNGGNGGSDTALGSGYGAGGGGGAPGFSFSAKTGGAGGNYGGGGGCGNYNGSGGAGAQGVAFIIYLS